MIQDRAWWFASLEYRYQNAAIQTGERDFDSDEVLHTAAPADLRDLLFSTRFDDQLTTREQADGALLFQSLDGHQPGPRWRSLLRASAPRSVRIRSTASILSSPALLPPSPLTKLTMPLSISIISSTIFRPSRRIRRPPIPPGWLPPTNCFSQAWPMERISICRRPRI